MSIQHDSQMESYHQATLEEVEAMYGTSSIRRKFLMLGLRKAVGIFELSGVRTLWINGSFITDKEEPRILMDVGNIHLLLI